VQKEQTSYMKNQYTSLLVAFNIWQAVAGTLIQIKKQHFGEKLFLLVLIVLTFLIANLYLVNTTFGQTKFFSTKCISSCSRSSGINIVIKHTRGSGGYIVIGQLQIQ
jgi:hypothetical protein